jgi:hypothetical protein
MDQRPKFLVNGTRYAMHTCAIVNTGVQEDLADAETKRILIDRIADRRGDHIDHRSDCDSQFAAREDERQ